MTNRVVVIGLDGATWLLLKPWVMQGELPNIARLMRQGVHGYLRSVIQPYSAPAWSSFMTGKNPGKHGLIDFFIKPPNSYTPRYASARDRRAKSLWRLLSEAGKRVCVMNVPMTYPPEEVNGYLITGLGTPGTEYPFTYPPQLKDELGRLVGRYTISLYVRDYVRWKRFDRLLAALHEVTDKHIKVAKHLFAKERWDLFVWVLGTTDQVQHFFWRYMDPGHPCYSADGTKRFGDAILSIYRKADAAIGELLAQMDEQTTIFVISDHGFGPCSNKGLYLNRWLEQEGYLRFLDNLGGRSVCSVGVTPTLLAIKAALFNHALSSFKKLVPRKIKNKFRNLPGVRAAVEAASKNFGIDWRRTRAYADELRGNIWLNVKGRDPLGIVEPGEEYERLRDEIIAKLRALRDPDTGEPVVGEIYKREELYQGPYVDDAPDILFLQAPWLCRDDVESGSPRRYNYMFRLTRTIRDRVWLKKFTPQQLEGDVRPNADHRLDGILVIAGHGVAASTEIEGATLLDLAPTILHLLGLAVPSDMDGRVLTEALEQSFLSATPVRKGAPADADTASKSQYSDEELKKVEESLRALGYID